ncbi:hypothetical protein [Pseudomonas sp. NFIX28]|uniref:hypothetical protein n=1 Tax=Pseudomonas sp. NFIX28 TaxID=1566235 RepID=UPI0008949F0A|nr:hypothetical protein [Pseudomonas sp. NFIX28]SDZ27938.1 hypothetical protein SAMN03159453_02974 [Pseudomonas sp. NFIX28]
MGRMLALIGVVFTILYVVFVWWLVGDRLQTLQGMELNEVGDFLAGAFGPLAILWLVLGFFQQGIELRQGTDALRLQAEELSRSVVQQCEMVAAQKASLQNYERSLEPLLHVSVGDAAWGEGEFYIDVDVKNTGDYCESVKVHVDAGDGDRDPLDMDPLISGGSSWVRVEGLDEWGNCKLVVSYKTRSGTSNSQSFTVSHYQDDDRHQYYVTKHPFLS